MFFQNIVICKTEIVQAFYTSHFYFEHELFTNCFMNVLLERNKFMRKFLNNLC